jgi:hypothetical protein|tara:strand:- start:840 stop:1136 length:297 start_codon:yes stop_codon:yes gene_type:complete
MSELEDSPKEKTLYLFLPGLLGWIAGAFFFFTEVNLFIKIIALLIIAPFFIGLLSRIDKKLYFESNFKNVTLMKKIVYIWNAGVILLMLSLAGGDPSQ